MTHVRASLRVPPGTQDWNSGKSKLVWWEGSEKVRRRGEENISATWSSPSHRSLSPV